PAGWIGGGGLTRRRSSITIGIKIAYFATTVAGTVCGTKSSVSPGTLDSNGQRYTVGSSSPKLPCPGGLGAVHSRVVACQGLCSTARFPAKRLKKKLNRKIN